MSCVKIYFVVYMDRQTDRQAAKQTDRQTHRQADIPGIYIDSQQQSTVAE